MQGPDLHHWRDESTKQNRLQEIDEILVHLFKEQKKKLDTNIYRTIIYKAKI